MAEAGMATRIDGAGNLIGRYEGTGDGPPLIIASHIDSVRDGGFYDGPLGVMLGVECVAALHEAGRRMPFPIEVIAFGDEEGSRFPAAMLTSKALAGVLDHVPDMADANGVSLPRRWANGAWRPRACSPRGTPARWPISKRISSRGRCWKPRGWRWAWSPALPRNCAMKWWCRGWPAMPARAPCRCAAMPWPARPK
jgi:hypothetical protein